MARDEKIGETFCIELTPTEAADLIAKLAASLARTGSGATFNTPIIPMDDPKDTGRNRRVCIYINHGIK